MPWIPNFCDIYLSSLTPSTCQRAPFLIYKVEIEPLKVRPQPWEPFNANCIVLNHITCTWEDLFFLLSEDLQPKNCTDWRSCLLEPIGSLVLWFTSWGRCFESDKIVSSSLTYNDNYSEVNWLYQEKRAFRSFRKSLKAVPHDLWPGAGSFSSVPDCSSLFTRDKQSLIRYSIASYTPSPVFALVSKYLIDSSYDKVLAL